MIVAVGATAATVLSMAARVGIEVLFSVTAIALPTVVAGVAAVAKAAGAAAGAAAAAAAAAAAGVAAAAGEALADSPEPRDAAPLPGRRRADSHTRSRCLTTSLSN